MQYGIEFQLSWGYKQYVKSNGVLVNTYNFTDDPTKLEAYTAVWQHWDGEKYYGGIVDLAQIQHPPCEGIHSPNEDNAHDQDMILAEYAAEMMNSLYHINEKVKIRNVWQNMQLFPLPFIEGSGRVQYIRNWSGETQNPQTNLPSVCQFCHELTLLPDFMPPGIWGVEVEINGYYTFNVPIGGTLSLNQLAPMIPYALQKLPEYTLGECYDNTWNDPLVWVNIDRPKPRDIAKDLAICVTKVIYNM